MTDRPKVMMTTKVFDDQLRRLNDLSRETQVPRAALIRNALDLYLASVDEQRSKKKSERLDVRSGTVESL